MRVLFYTQTCKLCIRMLNHMQKMDILSDFNCIDIDTINSLPPTVKTIPTIIDTDIELPLEGKFAFDYITNNKYFNNPTNNIKYWKEQSIPKPNIKQDDKAITQDTSNIVDLKKTVDSNLKQIIKDTENTKKNKKLLEKLINKRNKDSNNFFNK